MPRELFFVFSLMLTIAVFEILNAALHKGHSDVMLQALTSSELRSRLSKQGKRFQQQLTERGALHQLMTAVQSGDSDAKLQLFGITKVCITSDHLMQHKHIR